MNTDDDKEKDDYDDKHIKKNILWLIVRISDPFQLKSAFLDICNFENIHSHFKI